MRGEKKRDTGKVSQTEEWKDIEKKAGTQGHRIETKGETVTNGNEGRSYELMVRE